MPFESLTDEERDAIRAGKPKPLQLVVEQITDKEATKIAKRFSIKVQKDLRARLKEWVSDDDMPPLRQLSRYFFDHPGATFE